MAFPQSDIVIVGAGLTGLACAVTLQNQGIPCRVLEASDAVGGRVRTDVMDGFRLNRGFQVHLSAYPHAKAMLDYDALRLRAFKAGARIRIGEAFHLVTDPWRNPMGALSSLFAPVGTLQDKLTIAKLRSEMLATSLEELVARPEATTLASLQARGFSEEFIARFFKPFLGGIFLENELVTSSRFFEFIYKMFSEGDAVLPEAGMQAIPEQLAAQLPEGTVQLNTPVVAINGNSLQLASGETLTPDWLIVATDAAATGQLMPELHFQPFKSVTTLYYAADKAPIHDPILILNGNGAADGPINDMCIPSEVVPAYAPQGKALISLTVLGTGHPDLESDVRRQLKTWFGGATEHWRLIKTYEIAHALPRCQPGEASYAAPAPISPRERCLVCGDFQRSPSIQGALEAGSLAAGQLLSSLKRSDSVRPA